MEATKGQTLLLSYRWYYLLERSPIDGTPKIQSFTCPAKGGIWYQH
jgi:hypothetical protein